VRRRLHAAGLRYRVAYPVPGQRRRTIDIAFTRVRLAIFIDGCFWHSCPEHLHHPRANSAWWVVKLEGMGWTVRRFWEYEPADDVVRAIAGTWSALRHDLRRQSRA
jgi:DNA mismatch endonuclease (patch repair protein)